MPSDLQRRFPLSPRKFWKKILGSIVLILFGDLVIAGVLGIIPALVLVQMNLIDKGSSVISITFMAVLFYLIVVAIHVTLYSWYIKTYIRRYYYAGEEQFLTIKKRVFTPREIHVQYQKIQDVYVDQDLMDRILGLYDVHIASATAASGMEAHIDGVDEVSANGLKDFLLNKIAPSSREAILPDSSTGNLASAVPQAVTPFDFKGELSSNTYPLSGKWMIVEFLARLLTAFSFPAVIILLFMSKAKEISFTNSWLFIVLGWLALGFLTIILRTITLFLWTRNYAFSFNPENIYFRTGVISISEKNMPYSSIQDVTVQQGILDRIFGLAKLSIANAAAPQVIQTRRGPIAIASGITIQGISVADANKIADALKSSVLGKNSSQHGL